VYGPEKYIEVLFSDLLDPDQDIQGLLRVKGYRKDHIRFKIIDSQINIYSSVPWPENLKVVAEPGIKSLFGNRLKKTKSYDVAFSDLLPGVRFIGKRTIIPTSQGLTIPIETANLKAVVVTAAQIFNNNVSQFFQVNPLNGNNQIHRVGQNVFRKVIPLQYSGNQKNRWIRHGLDISSIIKKRPGGFYRIELTFLPEHIAYPCDNLNQGLKKEILEEELPLDNLYQEIENSFWDMVGEGTSFSWNDYYRQRKNPCHPGFYQNYYDHNITVSRNVLVSDIGLIAKKGDSNDLMVAVTDLKTALPLNDVKLTLLDYQKQPLASGVSPKDGLVHLTSSATPFLLIAEHQTKEGVQFGYLRLDDGSSLSTSHFDVTGHRVKKGIKGFIYGERGVWRPGDPIYLTFILHDLEKKIPQNHPVIFKLFNPRGQMVRKIVKNESVNGFYSVRFQTQKSDSTGNWFARVMVGGQVFSKSIRIETIKPNRLKINLDFGENVKSLFGEKISGQISSQWLHGASAKGLKTDMKLLFSERKTRFKEYPEFVFDDPVRSYTTESHLLFEGQLDDAGTATFNEKIDVRDLSPGMLTAHFETRVFEPGGAFSLDQFKMPYHPFEHYLGIRAPKGDTRRGMLLTDKPHTVHLALVDREGNPVPEGKVDIKLYKISWRWWWEKRKESFSNFLSSSAVREIQSDTIEIKEGKGEWEFEVNYPEWGRYMIRAGDMNGNHYTGNIIYIDWPGWAGRAKKDIPGAASVLTITKDKEKYNIGDTITLTIPTGEFGRGLVSIESGSKVLKTDWIEGEKESVQYKLQATREMLPNVYAHVTFLQPHLQTANDLPIRMYGVLPIFVEDSKTHLFPLIDTETEFKPESDAEITIFEKSGRPMTYTIAVVDEGLLDLTRFKTPDPWHHFFKKEALGVKTFDLYDSVSGAYGGILEQLLSIGGGGNGGEEGKKKADRFPPMVRFLGPFDLEKNGRTTHTLDVPSYIGSVRVMVIAGHDGTYGADERAVFVRNPLMLVGTLPRVIGLDETVYMPVSVFQNVLSAFQGINLSHQFFH